MGSGCGISRMAGLTLYGSSTCPLSQSVHMTLDLLKLSYTYIEVNTDASGKHDLIAINPHNTVPVLVDDSLVITESSAAMTYLVSQHRPSKLYPEQGVKKRSQIDQRLQFNIGWWVCAGHLPHHRGPGHGDHHDHPGCLQPRHPPPLQEHQYLAREYQASCATF